MSAESEKWIELDLDPKHNTLLKMIAGVPLTHSSSQSQFAAETGRIVGMWNILLGILCVRTEVDSPRINRIARMAWQLIVSRVMPVVATTDPTVESPGLALILSPTQSRACVMVPMNWPAMVEQDVAMQQGAIVHIASRLVDTWSNLILNGKNQEEMMKTTNEIAERAKAMEASFLRIQQPVFQRSIPGWSLNDYQKAIMADFPLFLPKWDYTPPPFDLESARKRFFDMTSLGFRAIDCAPNTTADLKALAKMYPHAMVRQP